MRVVVTGASGLLGGNLAIELARRGFDVRATKRASSRTDHCGDARIDWVNAELGAVDSLTDAFRGADGIFHCAAAVDIRRTVTPELYHANIEGTRNVLFAARTAGVRRVVHCSSVGAVGLSEDGNPCNEDARWNFANHGMADGYVTTKRWAEDIAMAAAAAQDVVVVNPTYMFGPHDARPSSGRFIIETVRGRVPGYPSGYNNFVDVRDVAKGMVLAFEKGQSGRRYILGGENLSYRDVIGRIALVAGVAPPRFSIPRWAAMALGAAGDLVEQTGREPLVNTVAVRYSFTPRFIFTSARAKAELGYESGPLEPAIADALAWFRARRMI